MNNYMLDKLSRQKEEIENLMRNYQQPMNIFNMANQVDFEAKMIGKEDNPKEIMVQRKTAFISLENALLSIKDVNGDIKEYQIILPKTPEQIENEELKERIKELEDKLKERNDRNEYEHNPTNTKKWKSNANAYEHDESTAKTNGSSILE